MSLVKKETIYRDPWSADLYVKNIINKYSSSVYRELSFQRWIIKQKISLWISSFDLRGMLRTLEPLPPICPLTGSYWSRDDAWKQFIKLFITHLS